EGNYKAWGELRANTAPPSGFSQNLRMPGQYYDEESGLHYNTFRYYDPGVGRFISPDPIGLEGGVNLYAYAPNPLSWIDPWGWCPTTGGSQGEPQYAPRIRERAVQDPGGHNFPFSFDKHILSTKPVKLDTGAEGYALRGYKNGKEVVYNIIVKDNTVVHRDMVDISKWGQRSRSFRWPVDINDI
ncbi:RHS repeat-associated core domain-containing protein, partial [Neisseriaceae bacterium TC5R-5]|nr:RHS repeat-associated core domain-containing protein [Neisseriaceae bacterium TC5R-5]